MTYFLRIKKSILLHLSRLRENYFQKMLPFSRREINGQSSLLVSTMRGVIAFCFQFQQSVVIISLILQAIRSLMLSNLCRRSQQLKLKKVFLYDGGKPIVNHFTNNRVWESLGHTLGWPKLSSNDSSSKGSITSLKPRTWKNMHFFEKKRYLWAENFFFPFFSHSSNAVLKVNCQGHWAFGTTVWQVTMPCLLHLRCQYKCPSSRGRATLQKRKLIGRSTPLFEA